MESLRSSSSSSLLLCTLVAALVISLNLPTIPAHSTSTFEDQKNYYSTPDPGAGSTPPPSGGSHRSPPYHGHSPSRGSGGGSHGGSPPSHGGGGSYDPTPSTPPSHGGGSYNPIPSTPPSNCGIPPPRHDTSTPSTPLTPTPTPSTPSYQPPPSSSGGGYYNNPPPSGGGNTYTPPSTPTTPDYGAPPTTPILPDPGTPPTPTIPSPPFYMDPNFPFIGTCNYWRTHPQVVWGVLGFWTTMGNAFGVPNIPGGGANLNLLEALSNPRKDGLGALYREGTASFLNSMVNSRFPFTNKQVRESFVSALGSNKAANNQARVFKLANEGKLKPRH